MDSLKQNELHSEMSSTLMPFVAYQTSMTPLLTLTSSGCSDCYRCHPSLHSLSCQIIIFTLSLLSRSRSILFSHCSFNYFSFLSPFNFTELLPDLQLPASASIRHQPLNWEYSVTSATDDLTRMAFYQC